MQVRVGDGGFVGICRGVDEVFGNLVSNITVARVPQNCRSPQPLVMPNVSELLLTFEHDESMTRLTVSRWIGPVCCLQCLFQT